MPPPFVDIHTHRCAPEPGVEKVCAHRLGSGEAVPQGAFVAGVHPWDAAGEDFSVLDFFLDNHPGLVGIGEIGLDFSRADVGRDVQMQWLERQLIIAEQLRLPVVLHCVRAYNEMVAELKRFRLENVVFHGFTGSPELAAQLVERGYYLSFNRRSLQSARTVEALKTIPLEKIFLETDDDPAAEIGAIYGQVAGLRGVSVEELKMALYTHYKKSFPSLRGA